MPHSRIILNNIQMEWKSEPIKYLGIQLDSKLNFREHIKEKIETANNRLRQLYPPLNRKSRLRVKIGKLLYTSLIRPIITYGIPIWIGTSDSNFHKLETFQSKTLRIISRSPWFVRNIQIRRDINIESLKMHSLNLCKKNHLRLERNANLKYIINPTINRRLRPRLFQDIQV